MAPFHASPKIIQKIQQLHHVDLEEVQEAFYNFYGKMLEESRIEHQRCFSKLWFISETNSGRLLKVVLCENGDFLELLTAYDPDEEDLKYYEKLKEKDDDRG